jgi:hypothetical protein
MIFKAVAIAGALALSPLPQCGGALKPAVCTVNVGAGKDTVTRCTGLKGRSQRSFHNCQLTFPNTGVWEQRWGSPTWTDGAPSWADAEGCITIANRQAVVNP